MLVCSGIFFLLVKNKKAQNNKSHLKTVASLKDNPFNYIILLLRVFTFLLNLFLIGIVLIKLLTKQVTIFSLRNSIFSGDSNSIFSSTISDFFFIFVKAFVFYDFIMEMVRLIAFKKRKINYLTVINIGTYCIVFLDRIDLVRALLIIILVVVCSGLSIRKTFFKNKIFKRIIPVFLSAVILILVLRYFVSRSEQNIFRSIFSTLFTNLSVSYVSFDRYFDLYNNGTRIVDCNMFDILFQGVKKIIEPFTNLLGFKSENYNGVLAEYMDYAIDVGKDKEMMTNAFYSMYFNFLNGGGVVQTLFVSAFFGVILGFLCKNWEKRKNPKSLGLLVFFAHFMVIGLLRWDFSYYWGWVVLFLFLLPQSECASIQRDKMTQPLLSRYS